jgi:hypothetical protein
MVFNGQVHENFFKSFRLSCKLVLFDYILFKIFFFYRFFIASFYTKYDKTHFIINLVTMLVAVVPKFPIFFGVRLFDINRY